MMDSVKDVPVLLRSERSSHSTGEEERRLRHAGGFGGFLSPFSLKNSNKVIIPAMPKFFHYNLLKVTS